MPDSPSPKSFDSGLGFAVLGSELVAFAVCGVLLDYWLGTSPWLTVILTFSGMFAAVLLTIRLLKMEERAKKGPPS